MSNDRSHWTGNPILRNPYPELSEEEVFTPNQHLDAQWFSNASLGLFIHWGLSSVCGEYDLSWPMMRRPNGAIDKRVEFLGLSSVTYDVPPTQYWQDAAVFDASDYDPDKWLAAAKQAGFEYAVLTTRHHDGFALWPSEFGDFSTKNYLDGRDLVAEYVDACRRQGLKVGFYYSPPDWYREREWMNYSLDAEEGAPFLDADWNPVEPRIIPKDEKVRIREYNRAQVEELLTRYGQIDLLWFDCVHGADCISIERMRELQPGIVVNDRGRAQGDFVSKDETRLPEARHEGMWDYCDWLNEGGWGYMTHENYRPTGWFLEMLAKVRAWDGAFLINVGPDAHGRLPDIYYRRMEEIAAWMETHGDAVFGAAGSALWPESCNVPVTQMGATLYVHVHWRVDYPVVLKDVDAPHSVSLDEAPLPYSYEDRTLTFQLPPQKRSALTAVVVITNA